ncbi:hypothetical protein IT570_11760 [Candidatus Sumerlaeota bacterium]|nr:hypothetical protein [Candidatus Sumerlaeota bacterium]
MKIRIQDNSIRFRVTLKEVELFAETGVLERSTQCIGHDGLGPLFKYSVVYGSNLPESSLELSAASITLKLCSADREMLLQPDEEGVYIRREWVSPEGKAHRFMALVEKDRPGSTCVKKEQWIYDVSPAGAIDSRPIPQRKS